MRKAAFCLLVVLSSVVAAAQDAFYFTDTHNEFAYPVLVPYADEQSALTLEKAKSGFYLEITGKFSAKAAPVKTVNTNPKNAGSTTVTSVQTVLDLPESWQKREKIIAFAPQRMSFTLLINGREVTWIEKELPIQFDITPLLKEKENSIELKFSGRSVYKAGALNTISLIAAPSVHVVDIFNGEFYNPLPTTELNWCWNLAVKNYGAPPHLHNHNYLTKFYDHSLQLVNTSERRGIDEKAKPLEKEKIQVLLAGYSKGNFFKRWTSEAPNLYLYTMQVNNPAKEIVEVVSGRAGFREISVHDNKLSLSSTPLPVPLTLRPVLYQPPASYNSLHSEELTRQALTAMKTHNVNTVILSGYPARSTVYDLCDELGLYVVQKIDVLSPETLQKLTPDQRAEEMRKERSRIMAAALHLEDHPSVIALFLNKNYSPELANKLLLNFINDRVSITAYQDRLVFKQHAYDLTLPIDWYRVPVWNTLNTQERADLKKQYQYAEFVVKGTSENKLYLTNAHDFVGLEDWGLRWQINENGKMVQEGQIPDLQVLPKKTLKISLPFAFQTYQDRKDCVFRFTLNRKTGNAWAKPGDEAAWEEFKFVSSDQELLLLSSKDLLKR